MYLQCPSINQKYKPKKRNVVTLINHFSTLSKHFYNFQMPITRKLWNIAPFKPVVNNSMKTQQLSSFYFVNLQIQHFLHLLWEISLTSENPAGTPAGFLTDFRVLKITWRWPRPLCVALRLRHPEGPERGCPERKARLFPCASVSSLCSTLLSPGREPWIPILSKKGEAPLLMSKR